MKNFYFTFGTSPSFPYQNGWVVVQAPTKLAAINVFCSYYPRRADCINCSFVYTEEEFKRTGMYDKNDNLGAGCHEVIGPHLQNWNLEE